MVPAFQLRFPPEHRKRCCIWPQTWRRPRVLPLLVTQSLGVSIFFFMPVLSWVVGFFHGLFVLIVHNKTAELDHSQNGRPTVSQASWDMIPRAQSAYCLAEPSLGGIQLTDLVYCDNPIKILRVFRIVSLWSLERLTRASFTNSGHSLSTKIFYRLLLTMSIRNAHWPFEAFLKPGMRNFVA